jgi:hypothetical protein
MNKKSTLGIFVTESRRGCESGTNGLVEWTYERLSEEVK